MEDVEMRDVNVSNYQNTPISEKAKLLPFVEKYRPSSLSDILSHEDILSTINLFISKKSIPHFLFHGPPGTGKTSCILALARQLYGKAYKSMTLELNASDDRGINVVRDKIKDFCGALSSFSTMLEQKTVTKSAKFKLVILDEADMMTSAAQFALRRVIEKYTKNVRFCLICNQVNKIIPAIQSRCMRFRFSPLKQEQCFQRLKDICAMENIPLQSENSLYKIISIGKGDMRKIWNLLESTYMSSGLINDDNVYNQAGLPSEAKMREILEMIGNKANTFEYVYKEICNMKVENGYAMGDLIDQVCQEVRMNVNINDVKKREIFKWFAKMDYLDNIGGNEKIIWTTFISALRNI